MKRFGLVVPGFAALASCVDMEPVSEPETGTTTAAVSSAQWDCTVTCSCRYSDFTLSWTTDYTCSSSSGDATLAQKACLAACDEDYRPGAVSAMAGPSSCQAIKPAGGGSGSGSGSGSNK